MNCRRGNRCKTCERCKREFEARNEASAQWKRDHPEEYRAYQNEWAKDHREYMAAKQRDYRKRNKEKIRARNATAYAVRSGKLTKTPCEVCGEPKVEAHHENYSKPLEVRWLCRIHHRGMGEDRIVHR